MNKNQHDHTTRRDLFVVLTHFPAKKVATIGDGLAESRLQTIEPDGFDAIGDGFETIGEALRVALELSNEIDFSNLTRAQLIDLAYSIDPNGSWDADEEGQQPMTEAELINAIESILEESK